MHFHHFLHLLSGDTEEAPLPLRKRPRTVGIRELLGKGPNRVNRILRRVFSAHDREGRSRKEKAGSVPEAKLYDVVSLLLQGLCCLEKHSHHIQWRLVRRDALTIECESVAGSEDAEVPA